MKNFFLYFIIIVSINFSFAQTDLVKKKIVEKYAIKDFEVIETPDIDSIVNYLIKFRDGSFKIFDSSRNELLPDQFKEYSTDYYTYFNIAINNSENKKKEWIIYNIGYSFYSKKWNPIRIPFETYDKILLGDDSEGPDLIGVKGNDKTIFSLDFEHNKIFNVSKLNFYGDANFLETNKTYFPFNYGRIAPYKLEKSSNCPENCKHKSPFCKSSKIVYRFSEGGEIKGYGSNDTINLYNEVGEQIVNTNDSISSYAFNRIHPASGIKELNIEFDSIIYFCCLTPSAIVKKYGFFHLYDFIDNRYSFTKIDDHTENFVYNTQGIYTFLERWSAPEVFLPIFIPKDVNIKKEKINDEITYTFSVTTNNIIVPIIKLNFAQRTITIIEDSRVKQELSFEEYAKIETEKRKENPFQKWKTENPIYDPIYKDATYKEKYDVIKNSEFFNEQVLATNYYNYSLNLPIFYNYFKLKPSFFNIDYLDIDLKLIEQDETNQGAVLFYDNFINIEGASASARLKALDEIITLFPTISELYYYRSYLNFNLNNNQEALDDINKCVELNPTVRNYIRRIVHSSYSISSFEKNKININNDINAAINLLKSTEGENYWVDYYLYWAKINFLLENKILSKKQQKEEICLLTNSILDLLKNNLIDREDLLQGELEKIENIKQKSKCK